MKKSEAIKKFRSAIEESMVDAFRSVLEHNGRDQFQIYVWENGEIERLEGSYGDQSYLRPRNSEARELFYVCTVDWNYMGDAEIEDIEEMVEEYNDNVSSLLDYVYAEAKEEEEMELM